MITGADLLARPERHAAFASVASFVFNATSAALMLAFSCFSLSACSGVGSFSIGLAESSDAAGNLREEVTGAKFKVIVVEKSHKVRAKNQ